MTQIVYNNPINLNEKIVKNKELNIDINDLINNEKY